MRSLPHWVTCEYCHQEMAPGNGCTARKAAIPYGEETRFGETFGKNWTSDRSCHDCGATKGQFHHPGCDMEECPECHGQAISCACYSEKWPTVVH